MKKITTLALISIVSLCAGAVSALAEDIKIGVVDMPKALQSVEAGKKAKAQLEKEVTAKKKTLQDEDTSFKKAAEEFKKQSLVMSDDARNKKQTELQERFAKLQELQARSQMELQQKEAELVQPIVTKLRAIIHDVAKTKGYTIVLEKNENTVLFSQDKDDITTDVVGQYNKQAKPS